MTSFSRSEYMDSVNLARSCVLKFSVWLRENSWWVDSRFDKLVLHSLQCLCERKSYGYWNCHLHSINKLHMCWQTRAGEYSGPSMFRSTVTWFRLDYFEIPLFGLFTNCPAGLIVGSDGHIVRVVVNRKENAGRQNGTSSLATGIHRLFPFVHKFCPFCFYNSVRFMVLAVSRCLWQIFSFVFDRSQTIEVRVESGYVPLLVTRRPIVSQGSDDVFYCLAD